MTGNEEAAPSEANQSIRKKVLIITTCVLAVVLLPLVVFYHVLGIHSRMDVLAYRMMIREQYHPVWKDLALRRIRKGDDLQMLLQKHPPVCVEAFGSFASVLYNRPLSYNTLGVIAKDGRLISARAGSCTWHHVFFNSPEEEEALDQAYSNHIKQVHLDIHANLIHLAITNRQDVFLAGHIESREAPNASPTAAERMEELERIYGRKYFENAAPNRSELVVEVNEALYGDLEAGTILIFPNSSHTQADEDSVSLRFEDARTVYPHAEAEPVYLTAPKEAFDWYHSLSEHEIEELEARIQARRASMQR